MYISSNFIKLITAPALFPFIISCAGSETPTASNDDGLLEDEIMIDATAGGRVSASSNPYTYVNLATGQVIEGLSDTDAESSNDWHIAFKRTEPVKLNGGVSGPGTTVGALAVESDMYDGSGNPDPAIYPSMSKENEADHFNDLILADVESLTYEEDTYGQVIPFNEWGHYNPITHTISPTNKWWIVRSGNGDSYAKLRISDFTSPNITIEYYLQGTSDSTYSNTPQTFTTSLSGDGSECIDFDTGTIVASCDITNANNTAWDLLWEKDGFNLNVWTNGGVHGSGNGGAIGPNDNLSDYDNYLSGGVYTDPVTMAIFEPGFSMDSAGGVFSNQSVGANYGWAEYGLGGDNNSMWPNYRVWAIRTGTTGSYTYYKIQITNYYNQAGTSGYISFRLSELE